MLASLGERDERGGGESEFAPSSLDDRPLDRIAELEVAKKLRRRARTDSYFLARVDLWLDSQPRLAKADRLKPVAPPRRSTTPPLSQERIP